MEHEKRNSMVLKSTFWRNIAYDNRITGSNRMRFGFEEVECLLFSMGLPVLDSIVSVIYSYFAYEKTQNT